MSVMSSLSSVISPREDKKIAMVTLIDLNEDGSPNLDTRQSFQYFPETISDHRSVEWVTKNVVGGSHPIYQWVYGSGRTLSFEAIFTTDNAPQSQSGAEGIAATIENIGTTISNVTKNPLGAAISAVKGKSENRWNLGVPGDPNSAGVEAALAWLRSKTYPKFQGRVAKAPPIMLLVLPNSGITSGVAGLEIADAVPVIMNSCDIQYEAFFRTGQPRVATVNLQFSEIIQVGTKGWGFVDRSKIDSAWKGKYTVVDNNYPPAGRKVQSLPGVPQQLSGALSNLNPRSLIR